MATLKRTNRSRTPAAHPLAGKGIVVTGGTTGIGRATALRLVARGAIVLVCGRHERELREALADLTVQGQAFGTVADLAKQSDARRLFKEADRRLPRVDVLVNNAALAAGGLMEKDYDDWDYVVRVNLLGYMACARYAIDRMRRRKSGHVVNVGSMSADVREKGSSIYVATKSAIQGFSAALRKEVNGLGIKVTLIEPGAVGTDMQPESPRQQRRKEKKGEMLTAEDVAACVEYCLLQPTRCDVVAVQLRPHLQSI